MRLLKKLFRILLIAILTALLLGMGYYLFVTAGVSLQEEKLAISSHSVTLLDKDGAPVCAHSPDFSTEQTLFSEIPTHTKNAFIAVEDKRFYSHNGFDYKRIVKSIYNNLKAGTFKQGASTISQQLVKNTHLTHEKTLKRKLREFKLTRALEKHYSKDEILHRYLSVIYFGHDCFGLTSAARFYFDKEVKDLDIADSAILAGLVKSPNNYSPFQNPEACQKRKKNALSFMYKNGYITEEELQTALEKPLPTALLGKTQTRGFAKYVFKELSALAEEYSFGISGRIEIDTYLDAPLQAQTEKIVKESPSNATAIVMDAENCGVKAFASDVGHIRRLPGSLLKPLLVYAPAMEENYISPATPLLDEKINYGGYSPSNYNGKYHGYISARDCLAKSLNVPAVKLLDSVGVEKCASYLEKVNLKVNDDEKTLALALGGMKNGYTFFDLLSAYSVFPNGGVYSRGAFIKCIRMDGIPVYQRNNNARRVFSAETSYLISDMLQTASKSGTAKKLRSLPFEIAAKTGTAGTAKGNTDAYAVSFTTRDLVGVWQGNAKGGFIATTGGGLPCNGVLSLNEFLYNEYTKNGTRIFPFEQPEEVEKVALDSFYYQHRQSLVKADPLAPLNGKFTEMFKKGAIPLNTSDLYSKPTIQNVTLSIENGAVCLHFENEYFLPYEYLIERTDTSNKKSIILYHGNAKNEIIDDTIIQGKKYIYTITPCYNGRKGTPFTAPIVNTKQEEKPFPHDKEIVEKDWWDY